MTPLQDMIEAITKEASRRAGAPERQEAPPPAPAAVAPAGDLCEYAEKMASAIEHILGKTAASSGLSLSNRDAVINQKAQDVASQVGGLVSSFRRCGMGKKAFDREALKSAILEKLSSGVDNPPHITGQEAAAPEGIVGVGDAPKATGVAAALLAGNEAARDLTKRDAKRQVVAELRALLAHAPFGDPAVLRDNLQNTSKAGVKIAEVREQLKLALASESATE